MPRPAKPTALHKLEGTYNATRHGKGRRAEPNPRANLEAEAPDWLTEDQLASWRHVVRHAPLSMLKEMDRGALAMWCVVESRFRQAAIAMNRDELLHPEHPLMHRTKAGELKPSPYVRAVEKAGEQLLIAARELGFTPASRPRLKVDLDLPPADAGGSDERPANAWDKLKVLHGGKQAG